MNGTLHAGTQQASTLTIIPTGSLIARAVGEIVSVVDSIRTSALHTLHCPLMGTGTCPQSIC